MAGGRHEPGAGKGPLSLDSTLPPWDRADVADLSCLRKDLPGVHHTALRHGLSGDGSGVAANRPRLRSTRLRRPLSFGSRAWSATSKIEKSSPSPSKSSS